MCDNSVSLLFVIIDMDDRLKCSKVNDASVIFAKGYSC